MSLPYLPFVEALSSYAVSQNAEDLKKQLGAGALDVGKILPEIRERLGILPMPPGDPTEDRYRLMQGVVSFLCRATSTQPLLIVLEDLHDADKGTLDMLKHVSRGLSSARLMVVGTYRDIEVDRGHPLSETLMELRRASSLSRIVLRGISVDEVHRMMSSIAVRELSWGLAEAVHQQTEGNPLFVQEVLRYLVEEGLLEREDRRSNGQVPLSIAIPEGLRDVIGKRLSLLGPVCNRLLRVAAVIGQEFRLDMLQRVADLPDERLFAALEEAKKVKVLEEHASAGGIVNLSFTHTLFRQMLYEENIAPRRLLLHQKVGRAVEELCAGRVEDYATELATHFANSSDPADLAKALNYAEMAARRATSASQSSTWDGASSS
jgi:predicted ATPase